MDGWITVGTKLDTKDLEKDIKTAENKMKQYEKEAQKLAQQKAKVNLDLSAYEKEKRELQEATDLSLKQAQAEEQVNFILEQENLELESLNQKYSQTFAKNESINKAIQGNVNRQKILNDEIQEMNSKLGQTKGLDAIKKSINQASKSMTGIIKKVTRWGLAIFSVRSAYMMIRSAVSTLSQYNEQLATDIEYIRYVLASTLEPIVKRIISLVKTLLSYIGYIAKAWFGVDLFAKSSAENFKKAKDGLSETNKEAKKLNKQLAGFDEMNIIQEGGSTKNAGGGGTPLPSFDLAAPEDVPIPSWLQWIADNKDLIIGIFTGIASAIAGIKIADFLNKLGLLGKGLSNLDLLVKGLGIGLILYGAYEVIKGIVEFIQDPSWESFLTILQGISLIVAGIAILTGGWLTAIIALGVAIVTYVIQNWDKVTEILGKVGSWIYEHIIKPVVDFFVGLWESIKGIFSPVIDFFANIFSTVWENIKIIGDNIAQIFSTLWNGIKKIFSPVIEFFGNIFSKAWNTIKKVFEPAINFFGNLLSNIGNKLKEWGGKVGDIIGKAFKGAVNGVLGAIESILNTPINAINGLIKIINAIPGIELKKLKTFKLPRLAVGAIINQPGRGVPVGGAIAGEAGREGIIPLTDKQAMAQLGAEIGRNVVIQLTNVTKLDNRQIAKEQKRINAQSDFAFNR